MFEWSQVWPDKQQSTLITFDSINKKGFLFIAFAKCLV